MVMRLSRLLAAGLVVGALLVALSSVLGGFIPVISALGVFARWAVLVAVLALILTASLRMWRWVGFGALVLALNLALVGPTLFSPRHVAIAMDAPVQGMKIVFFNTWWSNRSFDDVIAMIDSADPDVIVFVEVTSRIREGLRALDPRYPYRVECWQSSPCDSLILSRKELSNSTARAGWQDVAVGIAQAELNLDGCPVTLFAAHLARPWPFQTLDLMGEQERQARAFADAIEGWPGPKIAVGDFNASPWGHVTQMIAQAAKGVPLGGWSGTWPHWLSGYLKLPIDQIVVTSPLIAGEREVLGHPGSDHSAVLARLSVPDLRLCRP